ncbi:MAG: hypothetical protein OXE50_15570, partial [Chloroflexi bacterium]|nr:hypothetical protein [Chloroflexota bacterium]
MNNPIIDQTGLETEEPEVDYLERYNRNKLFELIKSEKGLNKVVEMARKSGRGLVEQMQVLAPIAPQGEHKFCADQFLMKHGVFVEDLDDFGVTSTPVGEVIENHPVHVQMVYQSRIINQHKRFLVGQRKKIQQTKKLFEKVIENAAGSAASYGAGSYATPWQNIINMIERMEFPSFEAVFADVRIATQSSPRVIESKTAPADSLNRLRGEYASVNFNRLDYAEDPVKLRKKATGLEYSQELAVERTLTSSMLADYMEQIEIDHMEEEMAIAIGLMAKKANRDPAIEITDEESLNKAIMSASKRHR